MLRFCSFVRFSTAEEAANAIATMYGLTIGNKTLLCKLSHGIPQNNATPSDNLYIKPLLDSTTEADLLNLFSPYGRVLECKVMLDKNTGQSRQIGFVRFATIDEATKALAANNGRYLTDDAPPMVVKYAESRSQKIARRAKLLANQVAAESRRNAQLKYQQITAAQSSSEMAGSDASAASDAMANDADATQGSAGTASMPYIVKDEYGNVTFAPEPEQVESVAQATAAPTGGYYGGRSNGHFEGRGGRRGGRGGHRPRGNYHAPYHPSEAADAAPGDETDQLGASSAAPHHGGPHATVYRKKGGAHSVANGSDTNGHASGSHPHNHHHAGGHHNHHTGGAHHAGGGGHYRPNHAKGALPTFNNNNNSPTPRVQLAGKVEVGKNGELSAPEWADDPTRLFISHLPLDYEPAALQALFEVHGTVTSSKISQDKRSARPKTYGFVQFATPESAAKAVKEMHGTLVEGRPINVAFEATQSVAKHRHEISEPYYYPQGAHYSYPPPVAHGGRGGRGGGRGRMPRSALPYMPAYFQNPYIGENGEAPPPYMYMVDPNTGMPYPYPVYFPSVPVPYTPDAEPYYPSNAAPAPAVPPAPTTSAAPTAASTAPDAQESS